MQIFFTRTSEQVDDGDWTFGQILPVILFAIPLMTIAEVFAESKKESNAKKGGSDEKNTEAEVASEQNSGKCSHTPTNYFALIAYRSEGCISRY